MRDLEDDDERVAHRIPEGKPGMPVCKGIQLHAVQSRLNLGLCYPLTQSISLKDQNAAICADGIPWHAEADDACRHATLISRQDLCRRKRIV